jgi:protein-arginine kinase activator protein McsA
MSAMVCADAACVMRSVDVRTDVAALRDEMSAAMAAQDFERCVMLRDQLKKLGAL